MTGAAGGGRPGPPLAGGASDAGSAPRVDVSPIEVPDWPEMSPAERTAIRLLGGEPRAYGELRRQRLGEVGAPSGDRVALKRVDKELCSGLRRLKKRGTIRQDPDGRYFLAVGSAQIAPLMRRYEVVRAELLHYLASSALRLPEGLGEDWNSPAVQREVAASGLDFMTLLKGDWADLRAQLKEFVDRGDRLYRRVPSKRPKNIYRSRRTAPQSIESLMQELDRISAEILRGSPPPASEPPGAGRGTGAPTGRRGGPPAGPLPPSTSRPLPRPRA